jgi:TPR repeat protein
MEPAACVDMARNDSSLSTTERLFLFATACLNGSGYGCDNAGLQLSTLFVDSTSAGNYLYRSCQLGDPNGCNNLGVLKERSDSEGVALKYYRQACEASNSFGCNNLALRLEFGYHSPELAVGYYARACELRTLDSCRRAIAAFDKLGRFDEEARYRAIACQLFASECKRKT